MPTAYLWFVISARIDAGLYALSLGFLLLAFMLRIFRIERKKKTVGDHKGQPPSECDTDSDAANTQASLIALALLVTFAGFTKHVVEQRRSGGMSTTAVLGTADCPP